MGYRERQAIISKIEAHRKSKVVCYITTIRPGVPGSIADDQVRVFFDHLDALPKGEYDTIDVFLVTNGGASTVPWRLVSLIREYAKKFNVLIPYKAMSAGSIFALGADQIVMHPLAEMGPIDPTVTNNFNPRHPQTGQLIGIGVEDVKAFLTFVTTTVGVNSEAGKLKALELLSAQVHPLAIGNVDRFINQARLVGEKLLATHMDAKKDASRISEIVDSMASKLYFHGHPINRKEAREDLGLSVSANPDVELEKMMIDLYKDFECEFEMAKEFNPPAELNRIRAIHNGYINQARQDCHLIEAEINLKNGLLNTSDDTEQIGALKSDINTLLVHKTDAERRANGHVPISMSTRLVHACIESMAFSDYMTSLREYVLAQSGSQEIVKEEIREQGWSRFLA